jgi:hypothetical protein
VFKNEFRGVFYIGTAYVSFNRGAANIQIVVIGGIRVREVGRDAIIRQKKTAVSRVVYNIVDGRITKLNHCALVFFKSFGVREIDG